MKETNLISVLVLAAINAIALPAAFAQQAGGAIAPVTATANSARLVDKISFQGNKILPSDQIRDLLRNYMGKTLGESEISNIGVVIKNQYTKMNIPVVVSYYTVPGTRPRSSNVFIRISEGSAPTKALVASRTTKRAIPQLGSKDGNQFALSTGNGVDWRGSYDTRDQRLELRLDGSSAGQNTLSANYGALLSSNFAVGTNLTYGPDFQEWLLNAAADLPSDIRIKGSFGQLTRSDKYQFLSGEDKASVSQSMYLASIAKSFEKSFFNEINLTVYGAEANKANTKSRLYVTEDLTTLYLKEDPRKLALGTMTGTQIGARLLISPSLAVTASAGQENVSYKLADGTTEKISKAAGSVGVSAVFDNCMAGQLNFSTSAANKSKIDASLSKGAWSVNASSAKANIEGQKDDTRLGVAYNSIGDKSEKAGCQRFSRSLIARGALLDAVVTRPSELPTSVFAKVDSSIKKPIDRISVAKAPGITGLTLDENGVLFIPIAGVTGGTVTRQTGTGPADPFSSTAITALNGGVRVVLEQLPSIPVGVDDEYKITTTGLTPAVTVTMVIENS